MVNYRGVPRPNPKIGFYFFSTSLSTRFPLDRPFSPLISAPTGFHDWGLVTSGGLNY